MRRALRKMPGAAPVGDFPGRRLRAFLAELEEVRLARLGPGATHSGIPVGLAKSAQNPNLMRGANLLILQ
jgi:hypothetical protein